MRNILAVILGVLVANVVFFLGSVAADRFYPTPTELMDPQTPEATALRVATAETNGLVGGFIGAKIAKGKTLAVTSAIGGLLCLWAVYSFYVFFPARLWFPAGMLIAFLVSTYLGGVASQKSPKQERN